MSTSIKGKARQNLLVATVNAALERRLITLECGPFEKAIFEFELAGLLVIGHVRDIRGCTIDVKANVLPTELGRHAFSGACQPGYRKYGAATVVSFLNRMEETCLQTAGDYHGTADITHKLAATTVIPNGFGIKYGDGRCRELED